MAPPVERGSPLSDITISPETRQSQQRTTPEAKNRLAQQREGMLLQLQVDQTLNPPELRRSGREAELERRLAESQAVVRVLEGEVAALRRVFANIQLTLMSCPSPHPFLHGGASGAFDGSSGGGLPRSNERGSAGGLEPSTSLSKAPETVAEELTRLQKSDPDAAHLTHRIDFDNTTPQGNFRCTCDKDKTLSKRMYFSPESCAYVPGKGLHHAIIVEKERRTWKCSLCCDINTAKGAKDLKVMSKQNNPPPHFKQMRDGVHDQKNT